MKSCVVPYCSSRGKIPGVSFHEFPANEELCSRWMKAISRKDWAPNSNSNNSLVCSKHFLDSDFKQFKMKRCLVKGAVPSVFPNYPKYMQPSPKFQRTLCSIEKRKNFCADKDSDHKSSKPNIDMTSDAQKKLLFSCNDKETQADFPDKRRMKEALKYKLRASRYLKKILTLEDELDNCKEELDEIKNNSLVKCLKVIMEEAEENVPKAVFIKDLILNYSKKCPRYSDLTIHHSKNWRSISTSCYEYGRKNIGLNLPSRSLLSQNSGDANNEEMSKVSCEKKKIKMEPEELSTMDTMEPEEISTMDTMEPEDLSTTDRISS